MKKSKEIEREKLYLLIEEILKRNEKKRGRIMREFRAKTTKKENREHAFNNIWVEGDLVVSRDKYYIHPRANAFQVTNELSKLIVLHEVIPETIEQYTGLTDKNGKKIFEGDIVKGEICLPYADLTCIVGWEGCRFIIRDINSDYTYVLVEGFDIEVIGNIYDNPELLWEEQNNEK